MSNWITAYFESGGVAQTGLTVKIYIMDLSDDSLAVNGSEMDEVTNGWYKFDWVDGVEAADYDYQKDYVGYCDSQSNNSDDRYIPIDMGFASVDVKTIKTKDAEVVIMGKSLAANVAI